MMIKRDLILVGNDLEHQDTNRTLEKGELGNRSTAKKQDTDLRQGSGQKGKMDNNGQQSKQKLTKKQKKML